MGDGFEMRAENPPRPHMGRGVTDLPKALAFATARPGEWCAVAERGGKGAASSLATVWGRKARAAGVALKTAKVTDGGRTVYRVYARFTPPAVAEQPDATEGSP